MASHLSPPALAGCTNETNIHSDGPLADAVTFVVIGGIIAFSVAA